MLEINNISAGYGKKQVLFDCTLQIHKNKIVRIYGGNGSGKTTLLKCIYNQIPSWTGNIRFNNQPTQNLNSARLLNLGMAYIPQKDFYFENLSVEENLKIAGNRFSKDELGKKIDEIFTLTSLYKLKRKKPFYLSGGERKVLGLCLGLINSPNLLMLDEPFAGVDKLNTILLVNLLNKFMKGEDRVILVVEHKEVGYLKYNRQVKMELGTIKN